MNHVHRIELPKVVAIGSGVLGHVGSYVKELRLGRTAAVVCGTGVTKSFATVVRDSLHNSGIEAWIIEVKEASEDEVNNVLRCGSEAKVEVYIGVGGGKAIDVAKYSAFMASKPFVSVPTSPSHDGVASPFASIRRKSTVTSMRATTPTIIVADVDVMSKAPRRNIVAGCGDLLGKLTAVLDWRLAHKLKGEYYGDYAASLALLSAKHIIKFRELFALKNIPTEAVRVVAEAIISSGIAMAIAGSTRPASGSEHLIAHAVDLVANYPALHGEEVCIGTLIALYLHGRNWKALRRTLSLIGAPTKISEIGVSREQMVRALTIAHTIRPERYTILGEHGITEEAAEKIIDSLELL